MIDLTTSDSRHVAGTLGRALAVCGLTMTVLQRCDVGISSDALRPGHNQRLSLTVHLSGDVCGSARHWRDEINKRSGEVIQVKPLSTGQHWNQEETAVIDYSEHIPVLIVTRSLGLLSQSLYSAFTVAV